MKLANFTLEDLLHNNFHILARKLFRTVDYKSSKKYSYYRLRKCISGYESKIAHDDSPYPYVKVPVYKIVEEPISKQSFNKNKSDQNVVSRFEYVDVTYEEEYNRIMNSKSKDKTKSLDRLFDSYYDLADEYYGMIADNNFIAKDYKDRVKSELLNAMHKFVENHLTTITAK